MKVYISADMEGITGLVDAEDVQPPGRDYERGRVMMTEDVNAAVRGAYQAGATAVLVNDAHGPMRNLLPDLLDPRAALIKGRPKPMGMLEGLTGDFDAVLCLGFHARAGTLGVLSHSFMGHEIEDIWLDDHPVGEIGLLHATATALGVPLLLLTGDDAACAEMTAWDPDVATVTVKQAKDRFAAQLVPVAEARAAIEATTTATLRRFSGAPTPPPTPSNARHDTAAAAAAAAASLVAAASPTGASSPAGTDGPADADSSAGADGPARADSPAVGSQAGTAGDSDGNGQVRRLAVRWQSASVASHLLGVPGVTRRDDRIVETTGTMPELYRLFGIFLRVATAVTSNPPYC